MQAVAVDASWPEEGNVGGRDEGKRRKRMPIKSQARAAYVCSFSNSAAHGGHVTYAGSLFDPNIRAVGWRGLASRKNSEDKYFVLVVTQGPFHDDR